MELPDLTRPYPGRLQEKLTGVNDLVQIDDGYLEVWRLCPILSLDLGSNNSLLCASPPTCYWERSVAISEKSPLP